MKIFSYASQAIKVLKISNSSSEVSPKVKLLCRKLDQNELEELELGWQEKENRYTRKEIQAICHSLYENRSLRRVSVGSRLEKAALQDSFLPAIAPLPNLQVLKLAVYSTLEESTIQTICRNPSLQELDIRGARLQRKVGIIARDRYRMEDYAYEDVNIIGFMSHLSHNRTIGRSNLQSLKLVNCGIHDEHIEELCEHQLPLEKLCLSGNAGVSSKGLALLLRQSKIRHLDVTDCGIDSLECVITALEAPSTIQELILSRNYRITSSELLFLSFFSAASQSLEHLDLSFCDLSGRQLRDMFQILKRSDCRLQSLILEGYRSIPGPVLCDMLVHNQSLQSLVFRRHDTNKRQLPLEFYYELSDKLLQKNYTIQSLKTGDELPADLALVLTLNRAGRRILKEGGDWVKVLASASHQTDVLHWLIRNGAGMWWSHQKR
jgi:hypothetical protein